MEQCSGFLQVQSHFAASAWQQLSPALRLLRLDAGNRKVIMPPSLLFAGKRVRALRSEHGLLCAANGGMRPEAIEVKLDTPLSSDESSSLSVDSSDSCSSALLAM